MLYDVKLTGFNSDEIIMIDLCMKVLNFDASQAYDCIDNMPSVLAKGVDMSRVKEIRAAFEKEGAILDVMPVGEENTCKENTYNSDFKENNTVNNNKSSHINLFEQDSFNLKYNPYENSKDTDNDAYLKSTTNNVSMNNIEAIKEKREIKYGRRSTDINPNSLDYGRRSTDINPMIFNERNNTNNYNSINSSINDIENNNIQNNIENNNIQNIDKDDIAKNESMQFTIPKENEIDDINDAKDIVDNEQYNGEINKINHIAPMPGGYGMNENLSAYEDLEDDNSEKININRMSLNNTHNENLMTKKEIRDMKEKSGYIRLDNSGSNGIHNSLKQPELKVHYVEEKKLPSAYNNLNNLTARTVNPRDALSGSNKLPPYSNRLNKSMQYGINNASQYGNNVSEMVNKDFVQSVEFNNEQINDKNNDSKKHNNSNEEKKDLIDEKITPGIMNFSQDDDFDDMDEPNDLYDLSKMKRQTNKLSKSSFKYQKEQLTCPKCGSAFVSTKKGQGIFNNKKIKYICEACNYKF